MKNQSFLGPFLGVALFCVAAFAKLQAQTWETFIPRPSINEPGGAQVLIDPFSADVANPSAFVGSRVGSIVRMDPLDPASYQTTLVDHSLSWVCRMDFNPLDLTAYAAGQRPLVTTPPYPRNNPNIWTVRKSSFNPTSGDWSTWSDSDNFSLDSRQDAAAYGFTADAAGDLYACGFANNKSGYSQWIVRRRLASGSSWSTIANVGSKGRAAAYAVFYYPGNAARNLSPALFVSGVVNNKWTVQRLEPNGSWTTVDTDPTITGVARSLTFDSDGNLYAVGYRETSLQLGIGWLVRMSTAGGAAGTWRTVLDVSEGYNSAANYVAIDARGDMWISGYTGQTMEKATPYHWTVMRVSPGQDWADAWNLRQQPFAGMCSTSTARGIATDDAGNVFVTGNVADLTDGTTTWAGHRVVVQRLVR